jgi:hypothetical protein
MDGAIHVQKSPVGSHFSIPKGDIAKAVAFYRTTLTEKGWKPAADPKLSQVYETKGAQLTFFKQGFALYAAIGVSPADGNLNAGLFHVGNIDARTLPRVAGASVVDALPVRTIYDTEAKQDAVKEFLRTELKKLGWQPYRRPSLGGNRDPAGADWELKFFNRAVNIDVTFMPQEGKTRVFTTVSVLREQLPVMPEAVAIEFGDEPLHLIYATPAELDKALEFHRQELAALGWKLRDGAGKTEETSVMLAFDAAGKEPLRLELLRNQKVTFVRITRWPRDAGRGGS